MKFFIITFVLIIITGCSTKPYALDLAASAAYPQTGDNKVYIVSHGWHTGFAVPSQALTREFPMLKQRFNDVPYYELGWGDHDFYQAEKVTLWLKIQAICWPTDTVMHVVAVPENPVKYFFPNEVIQLNLNDRQLASLNNFLINSFHRNQAGDIVPLKKGNYGNSLFFRGAGDYHLFNTCNKWTAKGLQSAGMDISPTFKLTAESIIEYLKSQQKKPEVNDLK